MISYFPEPYPDELFSSVLMRCHVHSGNINVSQTAAELLGDSKAVPNVELLGALPPGTIHVMEQYKPLQKWLEEHTMFPEYARLLPRDRRQEALHAAIEMRVSDLRYRLYMPRGREDQFLKYCPVCVKGDRAEYGEAYWHRTHQIQGVTICPKHACMLTDSCVSRISGYEALQSAAEIVTPEKTERMISLPQPGKMEIELSGYLADAFLQPIMWNNPVTIPVFLRTHMRKKYPISARRELVDLDRLVEELEGYYKGSQVFPLNMKIKIRRICKGISYPFLEIGMLAMFLEISPEELVAPVLEAREAKDEFDKEVFRLCGNGLTYRQAAEQLHAAPSQVKAVLNGYYKRERASTHRNNSCEALLDWEKLDLEALPKVQRIIAEMEGDPDRRPERVTVSAVARRLGTRTKHFQKLTQCMDYTNRYASTVEEHRARKLIWALQKIKREGLVLNKQRILELVKMDRRTILSVLPHLEKIADEETVRRIQELVE